MTTWVRKEMKVGIAHVRQVHQGGLGVKEGVNVMYPKNSEMECLFNGVPLKRVPSSTM